MSVFLGSREFVRRVRLCQARLPWFWSVASVAGSASVAPLSNGNRLRTLGASVPSLCSNALCCSSVLHVAAFLCILPGHGHRSTFPLRFWPVA